MRTTYLGPLPPARARTRCVSGSNPAACSRSTNDDSRPTDQTASAPGRRSARRAGNKNRAESGEQVLPWLCASAQWDLRRFYKSPSPPRSDCGTVGLSNPDLVRNGGPKAHRGELRRAHRRLPTPNPSANLVDVRRPRGASQSGAVGASGGPSMSRQHAPARHCAAPDWFDLIKAASVRARGEALSRRSHILAVSRPWQIVLPHTGRAEVPLA